MWLHKNALTIQEKTPQFKQVFKIYPLMTTALFWNISRFEVPNLPKAVLAWNYQQCFESLVMCHV